jgi:transposase-like protein
MAKKLPRAYPSEFRHRALELVRSGRSVAAVSRQLDVSRQTIMNWMKQEDADSGLRPELLTVNVGRKLTHFGTKRPV